MQVEFPEIILASASSARAGILIGAGVRFHQRASTLDEASEIAAFGSSLQPEQVALRLAERKAALVSAMEPNAVIIAADQVLSIDDTILQKPRDHDEARDQLVRLRGRAHYLYSAAVVVHQGQAKSFVDKAKLSMRTFSLEFLDWYLETASDTTLTSVGAYHFEGLGIHLFEEIEGDYFTILGLPIMPVLEELRRLNILQV